MLFRGFNSLRNLAVLYPISTEINEETKEQETVYYKVPEYTVKNLEGKEVKPDYLDSMEYLVAMFDVKDMAFARKQIAYADFLTVRHSGINIVFLWNNNNPSSFLIEDDYKLLERNNRLHFYTYPDSLKENYLSYYYPNDSVPGDYTLVDRNHHIRAYFDLEDAREPKKKLNILKLLDREFFKNERIRVEQNKD